MILLKYSIVLCSSVRGASGALGIPYKYIYICLPTGVVFMMLYTIEQFIRFKRDFQAAGQKKTEQGDEKE